MGERMSAHEMSGSSLDGHLTRYHLAAGFLQEGDSVLDAACGTGYGSDILMARGNINYYGVDKTLEELLVNEDDSRKFFQANLLYWSANFDFDVFIGFETVEHLLNYTNYINMAKMARRTILLSVPVIPTMHMNPWHLHDFEPGELPTLVEDDRWRLMQTLGQPSEFSEIYVFTRR